MPVTPHDDAAMPAAPRPPLTVAEQEAYDFLYTHTFPLAVEKARRILGDQGLAEDAAQSAFLRVWCHWSAIVPETRLGYLLAAVRNAATDELRHRHGHPGGVPYSIDAAPPPSTNGGYATSEERDQGRLSNLLADTSVGNDPEHMALVREELAELLPPETGDGRLRRYEMLLLAMGYNSREVSILLRRAAADNPRAPGAAFYARSTISAIKMRRSRNRARLAKRASEHKESAE